MRVPRYRNLSDSDKMACIADGEYVRYDDHVAAIAELKNDIASQQSDHYDEINDLTADFEGRFKTLMEALAHKSEPGTLEALADETLERIAEFFGKVVNDPDFCGFAVDELEEGGKPVAFSLIPCDAVAGEAVRRVAKATNDGPKLVLAR